jgi:hypothetical protein
MSCRLPFGHGPTFTLRVDRVSVLPGIGILTSANRSVFTIHPPTVVHTYPLHMPSQGGVLTIIGHSFGTRGACLFLLTSV